MGRMPRAQANGIELEYETFGEAAAQPLLLIGGLGTQMITWDEGFCELLAARGFHVIRFDNRDAGLSTYPDAEYTLDDMAADCAGLLDALGIPAAHVVGASMGGFIAQLVALDHRDHVLTLTSIMSGPNGRDQIQPTPEANAVLLAPAPETREELIALGLRARQTLLGPEDPYDEPYERARIERAIDRAHHPNGFMRQLQAIVAAESRLVRLRSLDVPTLVIHGDDDRNVPFQQTTDLVEKLRGQNVAFEELIIPDEVHDLLRWSDWVRAYRATGEFLDRKLTASGKPQ
jgi:pimeloyl-ACP methyl ester carboxylesterase